MVSITGRVTVTETWPLWPPLLAVIDAVPAPTAVTTPLLLTFAMFAALDDHVTVCPESTIPLASLSVGVITVMPNAAVSSTSTRRFAVVGLTDIDATAEVFPPPRGPVMSLAPPHATATNSRTVANVRWRTPRHAMRDDVADACMSRFVKCSLIGGVPARHARRSAIRIDRIARGFHTQWQKSAHCGWGDVRGCLPSVEFTPRVEMVEVQDRVEHERVGSDRLAAVDRIVGEQHDVPLLHRYVHNDGPLRDVATTVE